MHDHERNRPTSPEPRPDRSPGTIDPALVRSLADGELSEAEAAAARDRCEDAEVLEARIGFEQDLRRAVARSMAGDAAPAEVRSRVTGALAATASSAAPAPAGRPAGVLARLFHGPRQADWLAVAAVIMLVGAVIAFSVLAPNVDDFGGGGGGLGTPLVVNEAAAFAASEHYRCGDASTREAKFGALANDPAEAARRLAVRLDVEADRLSIPDLGHLGYDFAGLAACEVPGCGNDACGTTGSCHLLYRREGGGLMSVFAVRDGERFGGGRQECVCANSGRRVIKAEQNGLAWFFVCCVETDLERASREFLAAVDRL